MNAHVGRPVADLDDFLEPDRQATALRMAAADPPPPQPRRSRAVPWMLATAGLAIVVALGAWLLYSPAAPMLQATRESAASERTGAAGFAELYVAKYLGGDADAVAEFLPVSPQLSAMTPAALYAARVATIEIKSIGPEYWSVLVAADVLTLESGGYVPEGLQHFRVGVLDDGGRLVAAGLPSRVASPASRLAAPRSLAAADSAPGDAVAALAGDFLEALLVGGRDVARYTTTASQISPVVPHYVELSITSLVSYGGDAVTATVDARSAHGTVVTMQYTLHIDQSAGTPLVAAILPGPPTIDEEAPGQ